MAKYKAYPKYKDSGVEWLGEFPNSWDVVRLKHIASIYGRIGFRGYTVDDIVGEGEGAIVLSPSNIVDEKFSLEKKTFLRWEKYFESPEIIVKENDILLVKTGSTYGKSTIIKALSEPMTINPQMALIKKIVVEPRFLAYWFNTSVIKSKIEVANTGSGMPTMTQENINNFPVLIPPNKLDVLIADFLDHETAKIDNLIEKQQLLLDLLKEKRQAVISHAVTKGLNPDVPMKDSGVEWLGEIPDHWLCTKIKHIALLTPKKSSVNFKNIDECTFIPMEKLKRNSLVTDESKLIRDVISGYTYFEDDDLLLAKVTPCFENKNIAVARGLVNSIGFGSTEIYVLRPTEKIRVNYLLYRLQEDNFIRAATAAMTGAGGLKRVPSDFLLNYPIAIPPKPEMDAIVAYLNAQEVHYDLMEMNATQAVQLLQERRTALISAAVTGKIDVRDWVAPDTQDIEELQETTA